MATFIRIGDTIFDLERVTAVSYGPAAGVAAHSIVRVSLGGDELEIRDSAQAEKLWAHLEKRISYESVDKPAPPPSPTFESL